MSYTYAQRKRPQGQKEQVSEQSAPGPDLNALMTGTARPSAAQKGRPIELDAAIKAKMENAFGDLSAVKLYESPTVGEAGAEAMAQGNEIAFAPGLADFSTYEGQARLGHELSHVAARRSGAAPQRSGFLNDRALEARADREGAMAAAGQQVYSGPVTGTLSNAAPSAAVAGPMQAKRDDTDPKRGKANRKIIEDPDSYVDETAEGYKELDPTKWEEREKKRGFFASLFNQQRHFYKARIDRKAYEISPEELKQNRFNPTNVPGLSTIQDNISTAGSNMYGKTPEIKNGMLNRYAWMTFQNFASTGDDDMGTYTDEGKEWDMNEVDHTAFTNKLKNMTRMVHDYPELQGNIGYLRSIDQKARKKKEEEKKAQSKQTSTTDSSGKTKPKTLRKRKKRTIDPNKQKEMVQPAPMEGYQPNLSWQQDDILDPNIRQQLQDKEDAEEAEAKRLGIKKDNGMMIMSATFNPRYYNPDRNHQVLGSTLSLNAEAEEASDKGKKFRWDANERLTKKHGTTLDYAANHELGHMLNYALVKELNKGLSSEREVDEDTGKQIAFSSERDKANLKDVRYHITASRLVERALRETMPEEEFNKLVRYEEDSLGDDEAWDPNDKLGENEEWATKDIDKTTERFLSGQINLAASGLGATKDNRGYTTGYGATNASEFFAEAFADVYQNGSAARPTSIRLVQLYEQEMADAKKAKKKG